MSGRSQGECLPETIGYQGGEGRGRLMVSACLGMTVFGIVVALLGTLFGLPVVRERLRVDLIREGDLLLLLYAGIFVCTVLVGPLLDRFGHKLILVTSSVLVFGGLVNLAAAHSFLTAGISCCLLGLGGGGLNTSNNALVSDIFGERRGQMLNILGVFFGLGALLTPLVAASLTELFTVPHLILSAACLAAFSTAGYGLLRFPPAREGHSFSLRAALKIARHPLALALALLLFCETGNEASIGGWVSTYIGAVGAPVRTATQILAGYWVGLLAARVLAAPLLRRVQKPVVVFASGVGSVIGCGLLLSARQIWVLAVAVVIIGLSYACIFPTTLAIAGDQYQRFAGTLFGFLFSVALVGGMIFPWAIGHLSERLGMRSGMLLPLGGSIVICALTLEARRRLTAKAE